MDLDGVINLLKDKVAKGTQKRWADEAGVSQQFLSDVLAGRRGPSDTILDALNLERVITYRKRVR